MFILFRSASMQCSSEKLIPLVQSIHLCGEVSHFGHRAAEGRLLAQDNLVQGKPERANPVASLPTRGRRNAR